MSDSRQLYQKYACVFRYTGWEIPFSEITFFDVSLYVSFRLASIWDCSQERGWAISIARLSALLHVHLRPINVIVSDGPCVEILS